MKIVAVLVIVACFALAYLTYTDQPAIHALWSSFWPKASLGDIQVAIYARLGIATLLAGLYLLFNRRKKPAGQSKIDNLDLRRPSQPPPELSPPLTDDERREQFVALKAAVGELQDPLASGDGDDAITLETNNPEVRRTSEMVRKLQALAATPAEQVTDATVYQLAECLSAHTNGKGWADHGDNC